MGFHTRQLRQLGLLIAVVFTITTGYAQVFSFFQTTGKEFSAPKHEVRAVWLTTIGGLDWPHNYAQSSASAKKQQNELTTILDQLQRAGINTVLLQTRIRGTVIYPSQLEPWDGCLSGVPGKGPGYDALQFAIDECHRRGMEIHAWVVTIPVGKWNGTGCRHLRNQLPGLLKKIDEDGYMDPENQQTARHLADLCEEITHRYDIDGIHLDYIRYPETWKKRVAGDVGRRYITNIVAEIQHRVKALKPWVKMSCSPIGKFDDLTRFRSYGWNAYSKVCQDAQGWLREGLMDALFPMMYFQGNQFYPFAIDWAEQSYGRMIVPGLGIYFLSPAEKNWPLSTITRQLHVLRQYGMGHAYFRSKFFTDDVKGIRSFAQKEFTPYPALIPAMTWAYDGRPTAPAQLWVETVNGTTTLRWQGAEDRSGAPYLLYNVYGSDKFPVDVDDARNLITTRRMATSLQLQTKSRERYYAVTAIDRYGNESRPKQSAQPQQWVAKVQLLPCDGRWLEIPSLYRLSDADVLMIAKPDGRVISIQQHTGNRFDVSRLPNGFYVLKSLNRRGIHHRLGFFMIKR